jgi:ATP-binding cassette subfamily B (MDR/TAP) protein 1
MTLVLLAGIPPLGIAATLMFKLAGSQDAYMGKEAYQKAGSIASEVLGAMRTIVSIRGEKRSAKRYEDNLEVAEKAAIRQGWLKGLFTGLLWGIMFSLYGLGFWFGAQLIIWSTDDAIEKYPPPAGLMNATVNGTGPYAAYVVFEREAREVLSYHSFISLEHQHSHTQTQVRPSHGFVLQQLV